MKSARLSLIGKQIDPATTRILEIGALDSPTFTRPQFDVHYVDYASRQELSRKGDRNPRYQFERLVEVDHVVPDGRYLERIPHRYGLIVANHVIEHIADPIRWLDELGQLLIPGGWLFLSVPDRRYTFDVLRREASVIDWIRAHVNQQTKPDFFHLLDHFWHSRPVNAKDAWAGRHLEDLGKRRFTGDEAMANALKHAAEPYADVHCYAYTESSLQTILDDAAEFGFLGFGQTHWSSTMRDSNEFHVMLGDYQRARAGRVGMRL